MRDQGLKELVRLMDGTPVPCGKSAVTAKRSDLAGYVGHGRAVNAAIGHNWMIGAQVKRSLIAYDR